jgi:hypothetical protein
MVAVTVWAITVVVVATYVVVVENEAATICASRVFLGARAAERHIIVTVYGIRAGAVIREDVSAFLASLGVTVDAIITPKLDIAGVKLVSADLGQFVGLVPVAAMVALREIAVFPAVLAHIAITLDVFAFVGLVPVAAFLALLIVAA